MRRIIALCLALTMGASLASCAKPGVNGPTSGNQSSQSSQSSQSASSGGQSEEQSYPMTLTDQAGRQVTVDARPERLVSGYYISTSLLIALGLEDKLVGVEAKADKRAIYRLAAPQLIELPSVGTAKEFDLEGCAALEPDLVILPLKLKDAAERLEELGIPALLIDPESQEQMDQARDLVAMATGAVDRAEALEAFTDRVRAELDAALAGQEAPKVYLASNSDLLSTAGGQMYQSDLISMAGGQNVAAQLTDDYWAQVSYEQVLAWDPEYIILAADSERSAEEVLADPALAGCAAVTAGQVFRFPNDAEAWDSPVPGGILGVVWLACVLHPDRVSQEDCQRIIGEFYDEFYGFQYGEQRDAA